MALNAILELCRNQAVSTPLYNVMTGPKGERNTEREGALMDQLKEACGVFGIRTQDEEAAHITHNALLALQHRGQEGAGIAVLKGSAILYHKNVGLVSEVFTPTVLKKLPEANLAIGHVRYSTTGTNNRENTQPIITEYLKGRIATAHNGNITNASEIRQKLQEIGCSFTASNDSETISSLIAYEALSCEEIETAVENAVKQLKGAFSLVVLTSQNKLIAVRDGWGFRPLCIGRNGKEVAVCSESAALDSIGFSFERDVEPGEMIVIDEQFHMTSRRVLEQDKQGACIFEYIYFARTDSIIDRLSVYQARFNMGQELAREYPVDADIVCGVPDSGLAAAAGYAEESGLPLVSGFVKNRYIARSFIAPTQSQRDSTVTLKLNPLRVNVEGKRIVLVDDSIVRGTTSAKIIRSLKKAGAKEVHMRISSPPFRHPCYYGTDIDSEKVLIANQKTLSELTDFIGADSLGFISIEGLKHACRDGNLPYCTGCFDGGYPLDTVSLSKDQFE